MQYEYAHPLSLAVHLHIVLQMIKKLSHIPSVLLLLVALAFSNTFCITSTISAENDAIERKGQFYSFFSPSFHQEER